MRTVFSMILLSLTVIFGAVAISTASSNQTTVGQLADFQSAIQQANPGDVIIIKNGTYTDWDKVNITQSGKAGQPITIRAEQLAKVVFTGNNNEIIITGAFIVLDGLTFQNRNQRDDDVKAVIWLNGARHSRLTNCTFDNIEAQEIIYLGRSGEPKEPDYNQINHSTFTNNKTRLIHIQNNPNKGQGRGTRIDHNTFRNNHYTQGDDLGSLVRVGNAERHAYFDTGHIIEHNVFQNSESDGDLFHFKASGITIRHNRFEHTTNIGFRQGEKHVVEANVFNNVFNKHSANTYGAVRITGKGSHRITNNVFIDGPESRIAISLEYGNSDTTRSDIHYVTTTSNNIIANNTIYGFDDAGIIVGTRKGTYSNSGKRLGAPHDNMIINNIIVSKKGHLLRVNDAPDNVISNNLLHADGAAQVGIPGDQPVYGDPLFYSVAKSDFRLKPASLAIDNGMAIPQLATDINGQKRLSDNTPDIGAFEMSQPRHVVSSCAAAGYIDPHACQVVLFEDFDSYADDSPVPAAWWVEGSLGTWIENGRLYANADPGEHHSLLTYARVFLDQELSGDLQIEFDAHVVSSIQKRNNLNSVILISDPDGTPLRTTAKSRSQHDSTNLAALNGYQFNVVNDIQTQGEEARMRLRRQPGYEQLTETHAYHAKIGVTYHMKIVKQGAQISFSVDGIEYLKAQDQHPWHHGMFGLITWRSNVWWDNILIMSLNNDILSPTDVRLASSSQ